MTPPTEVLNLTLREALHQAADHANRHDREIEQAAAFLADLGWGRAFSGIEYVSLVGRKLAYLNMGDTYASTIIREGSGECEVGSWGEWYEAAEQQYCEENNVIRCGYCGEFTPLAPDCEWYETECRECGNLVGG